MTPEQETLAELLAQGKVRGALVLKGEYTEREVGLIREAWEAGLKVGAAELQAAQKDLEKSLDQETETHRQLQAAQERIAELEMVRDDWQREAKEAKRILAAQRTKEASE